MGWLKIENFRDQLPRPAWRDSWPGAPSPAYHQRAFRAKSLGYARTFASLRLLLCPLSSLSTYVLRTIAH